MIILTLTSPRLFPWLGAGHPPPQRDIALGLQGCTTEKGKKHTKGDCSVQALGTDLLAGPRGFRLCLFSAERLRTTSSACGRIRPHLHALRAIQVSSSTAEPSGPTQDMTQGCSKVVLKPAWGQSGRGWWCRNPRIHVGIGASRSRGS